MPARLLLLFCACLALTISDAHAAFEPEAMRAHIERLASSGYRGTATEGARDAADYIEEFFEGLEIGEVDRQTLILPIRKHTRATLTVDGQAHDIHPLRLNAISPGTIGPDGLSGPVIFVGRGELAEMNGLPIEDAIVFMDMESGRNWTNAAALGAKALVFIDFEPSRKGAFQQKRELTPLDFPRYFLPLPEARAIFPGLTRDEPTQLAETGRLDSDMAWQRTTTDNVYMFIEGSDPDFAERLVVIEAFYDTAAPVDGLSPGADAASSIAMLLEQARYLKENPSPRSVLLLATGGHPRTLAGMREFAWTAIAKGKDLRAIDRHERTRVNRAKSIIDALESGVDLAELSPAQAADLGSAVDTALKDEVDAITTRLMQLRLKKQDEATRARIRNLADQRMLLRRITWNESFAELSAAEREEIESLLPIVLQQARLELADAQLQRRTIKSTRALRSILAQREVVATVSLHLSSNGDGMGVFRKGFMFDIREDREARRNRAFSKLTRLMDDWTVEVAEATNLPNFPKDTMRIGLAQPWQSYLPDQPFLGGELSTLAGMIGMSFATTHDMRPWWGTPYDTPEKVDYGFLADQGRYASGLLDKILRFTAPPEADPSDILASYVFRETNRKGLGGLEGDAKFVRQGELFPDKAAPGTILQCYQDPAVHYVMVDQEGKFDLRGIADKKHTYEKITIEGYQFDEVNGQTISAINKPKTGKSSYRVKMNRRFMETHLIMFRAAQINTFNLLEPRTFDYMTKIKIFDGKRESEANDYWYSRIDTRESTMAAVYMPPETPMKMTLSDNILSRKLILTNATEDEPEGVGYRPSEWPKIPATELFVARDMWSLLGPRLDNLREHGIHNDRIRGLEREGREALAAAETARAEMRYDDFLEQARVSWSLASRVYNDVEKTQKDVLFGVLFYIALFVPFAYCVERVVLAKKDIKWRIMGFLAILGLVITVIYLVHPAFQLTYSPMVVILAFFIVGLSVLVGGIIFSRFEKEMAKAQQQRTAERSDEIGLFRAFGAAFVIGVSNLRRRKVRTILTIITLVILTFTVMSFTSVKSARQSGMVRFSETAPYQGLLMKDFGWASLPPEAPMIVANKYGGSVRVAPRAWLEHGDKTRPVLTPIEHEGQGEIARGVVGLSDQEPFVSGIDATLVGGRWFEPAEREAVILPAAMASRLGVDPANPNESMVRIWGMDFQVVGCFDAEAWEDYKDMDGEQITPVVFPSESVAQMSEAEVEALEDQADIRAFQGRYRHVNAAATLVLPYQRVMAQGGAVKDIAVAPLDDRSITKMAQHMVDRFGLTMFAGQEQGVFIHHASDSISYAGVPNIMIPLLISVLIVLNTMISSVYERKGEIGVYTSVGMAPTHVSFLFVAEAVAFGVISVVLGYLIAQAAAQFLADTSLWAGMTANYSSLAGVAAMVLILVVVLVSVIYPSKVAARIAIPDVTKSWTMPDVEGDEVILTLPFLLKRHEQHCAGGFLVDYYQAHEDISHGLFSTGDISHEMVCPMPAAADASPLSEESCLNIKTSVWLAPFDFGVRQRLHLIFCPAENHPEFLEIQVRITREAGEHSTWKRLNKIFLNDIRKQLLVWRSMDTQTQQSYVQTLQQSTSTA